MSHVLCRRCYRLFRDRDVGVVCRSRRCSGVLDLDGRYRPRYMRPREAGLWSRFPRAGLDLERPCPFCERVDTLAPACPLCRAELEPGIGRGDDRMIAVVGASESGKTHYLAAVLHQLLDGGAAGETWRVSMPEEDLETYRARLLEPFFERRQELPATAAELGPELRLELESRDDRRRVLVVFRDLGGEVFRDPERLRELLFLRYAQGVVLMADPLAFQPRSSDGALAWTPNGRPDAAEILANYRQVLRSAERGEGERALPLLPEQKYLAVAIPKADLVLPDDHPFWTAEDGDGHLEHGYWRRREPASRAAASWVERHLGGRLSEIARDFAEVGYFFVSNYGYRHRPHTALTERPRPLRVHEPIFGLLDLLAGRTAAEEGDEL